MLRIAEVQRLAPSAEWTGAAGAHSARAEPVRTHSPDETEREVTKALTFRPRLRTARLRGQGVCLVSVSGTNLFVWR